MFAARPGPPAPRAGPHSGPHLIRAERSTFPGEFLPPAGVEAYFADLARPYGTSPRSSTPGQSYGAMARALLPEREPVDLLVLAFSIHDLWPGRATATYLSHCCPGTPLSFAICDQGSAAAFTGLRIARDYLGVAGCQRALLLVVEQAVLPYDSPVPAPDQHRGVALLCGNGSGSSKGGGPAVTELRQYAAVPPDTVPDLVTAALAELSAAHVVLSHTLAAAWPEHPRHGVTAVPAGQPATGVWWHLLDALAGTTGPVVVADYDPDLRYLSLAGFTPTHD